jgi:hypothetical protein
MGMALAVTVAVGLVGSSLTWLWFRMSNDRHAEPDIESLVKQRRASFEENVQSAEKLIRKG